MSHPRNRKEAKVLGLKIYFTGKPCKRGEIAFRRLNGDCLCDKCAIALKQIKADYAKANSHKREEWALENPEKMKAYKQAYQEKNKTEQAERIRIWKRNNPEKILADFHKRRASKIQATPVWYGEFDAFVMHEALKLARLRQSITRVKWHVDHMIPLQSKEASGFHCASNIQVIPECMNVSKANRMMYSERNEWLAHL
jgi:hypothetical protein